MALLVFAARGFLAARGEDPGFEGVGVEWSRKEETLDFVDVGAAKSVHLLGSALSKCDLRASAQPRSRRSDRTKRRRRGPRDLRCRFRNAKTTARAARPTRPLPRESGTLAPASEFRHQCLDSEAGDSVPLSRGSGRVG